MPEGASTGNRQGWSRKAGAGLPRGGQVGDLQWSEPAILPGCPRQSKLPHLCSPHGPASLWGKWEPEVSMDFVTIWTVPEWVQRLNVHLAVL